MSVFVESGIEWDFTRAAFCEKHDSINSAWPGVDFLIDDGAAYLWLEIKNWEPSDLPPSRRGGQRQSFLCKMRRGAFFQELRDKFLGTTACLSLTHAMPAKPVVYIVLLESPKFDSAIKTHATHRMSQLLQVTRPWTPTISVAVMNLADWNALYPHYPARLI